MSHPKSGRIRVSSFPVLHTDNRELANRLCEEYARLRNESKLVVFRNGKTYEVRLEAIADRVTPFKMDEVSWAVGFATGFQLNWT